MTAGSASAVKPPPARASFAARLAAAMTEGSSIAIGTISSSPLTVKLRAMPSGRPSTPTAFSIIASALDNGSEAAAPSPSRSPSGSASASARRRSRSASAILRNPLSLKAIIWGVGGARGLVMPFEDVPAESAQDHFEERVLEAGVGLSPGRLDEFLRVVGTSADRPTSFHGLDHLGEEPRILGAQLEHSPEPAPALGLEALQRLCERQRDGPFGEIFGARLEIALEAAQVEHVVDDLKGEAQRLEEIAHRFHLHVSPAAGERAHARQ